MDVWKEYVGPAVSCRSASLRVPEVNLHKVHVVCSKPSRVVGQTFSRGRAATPACLLARSFTTSSNMWYVQSCVSLPWFFAFSNEQKTSKHVLNAQVAIRSPCCESVRAALLRSHPHLLPHNDQAPGAPTTRAHEHIGMLSGHVNF